jgi:hypothetical protein
MYGSRYLILAAVFAAAVAIPGCKRDLKAPEPKTANAARSYPAAVVGTRAPDAAPGHHSGAQGGVMSFRW